MNRRLGSNLKAWIAEKKFVETDKTVSQIADELGVSNAQLEYYFRKKCGRSFTQWRKEERIRYASRLLLECPDLSCSSAGGLCGIPDRSNFRRQFMEVMGVTPSEWKDNNGKVRGLSRKRF